MSALADDLTLSLRTWLHLGRTSGQLYCMPRKARHQSGHCLASRMITKTMSPYDHRCPRGLLLEGLSLVSSYASPHPLLELRK